MRPHISVIVPFLDAAAFLDEAIRSVFDQTWEAWDVILVDDGSTDGSSAIARGWADRHAVKVRYVEHDGHQNRGTAASRNLGVRHATAPLIAFLDADDVWLPHKLERQMEIMASAPAASMLYGRSEYWFSWTGRPEDRGRDALFPLGVPSHTLIDPPTLVRPFFLQGTAAIPCPSNVIVRREAIEAVGGFVEEFHGPYRSYEDQAFFAKLLMHVAVVASGECWDRYRQHPRSAVALARATGTKYVARAFFLDWLAAYLTEHGLKDEATWRDLERAQQACRPPAQELVPSRRRRRLLRQRARAAAEGVVPAGLLSWVRRVAQRPASRAPAGHVSVGDLRRMTPLRPERRRDHGDSIETQYIRMFLADRVADIRGRVLEIGDAGYARYVRGEEATPADTLHMARGGGAATYVGHLPALPFVPSGVYDCVLAPHALHLAYDVHGALRTLHRILAPGGVLLATLPAIRPVSRFDTDRWGDGWRFTMWSATRLLGEVFPPTDVEVGSRGNLLTATALLHGLKAGELRSDELMYDDPDYPVTITVRATKAPEVTDAPS